MFTSGLFLCYNIISRLWVKVCCSLCDFQGEHVWVEPATSGEFDVAIGATVKAVDGQNICLVDDDKKVSTGYSKLPILYLCVTRTADLLGA